MHFHDLRHTHKTWLIEDDIPEIAQAKRLGHRMYSKGTDLARWNRDDLDAVAATLKNRPRKTLAWKTPAEAMNEQLISIQSSDVATTG